MATSCSSLLLSDREEVAQDSCKGAEDPAQEYSQNLLVLTSNLTISEEYSTIGNEVEFSGDIVVKFDAISNEDWAVLYRVDSSSCLCLICVSGSFSDEKSVEQLLCVATTYLFV